MAVGWPVGPPLYQPAAGRPSGRPLGQLRLAITLTIAITFSIASAHYYYYTQYGHCYYFDYCNSSLWDGRWLACRPAVVSAGRWQAYRPAIRPAQARHYSHYCYYLCKLS